MAEPRIMIFEKGTDQQIGTRYRFICEWYKIFSHVSSKEELLSVIGKNTPDAVILGLNLYVEIDGIETTKTIRTHYNIPVICWIKED